MYLYLGPNNPDFRIGLYIYTYVYDIIMCICLCVARYINAGQKEDEKTVMRFKLDTVSSVVVVDKTNLNIHFNVRYLSLSLSLSLSLFW